jgi:hypothetical protein
LSFKIATVNENGKNLKNVSDLAICTYFTVLHEVRLHTTDFDIMLARYSTKLHSGVNDAIFKKALTRVSGA